MKRSNYGKIRLIIYVLREGFGERYRYTATIGSIYNSSIVMWCRVVFVVGIVYKLRFKKNFMLNVNGKQTNKQISLRCYVGKNKEMLLL